MKARFKALVASLDILICRILFELYYIHESEEYSFK